MIRQSLVLFCALIIWTASSRADDSKPSLAQFLASDGYAEIQLSQNIQGHFEAEASLKGNKKLLLLVDTGSNRSVFDKETFEKLGYHLRTTNVQAAGIGGSQMLFTLDRENLTLGGLDTGPATVFAINLSDLRKTIESTGSRAFDGIIGQDFLARYSALLDISRSKLYLHVR